MNRSRKLCAKLWMVSFAFILASFFCLSLGHARSEVLPDSVLFEGSSYYFDHSAQELKLKVPVIFVNSRYLIAISAPFVWSGPVSLDSASFAGSRVEDADVKGINIDSVNNKVLFGIVYYYDIVPAGRALLGTLYFSVLDAGCLDIDTTFFPPSNILQFQNYNPVEWTPEFVKLHEYVNPIQDTVYFEPRPGYPTSPDGDTLYTYPGGDVKINIHLGHVDTMPAFFIPLIDLCYKDNIFLDPEKNNGTEDPICFEGGRVEYWHGKLIDLSQYPHFLIIEGVTVAFFIRLYPVLRRCHQEMVP